MKLYLTIDGREHQIDLGGTTPSRSRLRSEPPAPASGSSGGSGAFRMDDAAEETFDAAIPTPGSYSILMGGRSYEAAVEETSAGLAVTVRGHRFEVVVRDPRRYTRKSAGGGGEGMQKVVSPMPGKVVRVLVAVGDIVEAGQGILVVEAMKMQNELKAPRAGRVVSVSAKEGATVTAGEVLAAVE